MGDYISKRKENFEKLVKISNAAKEIAQERQDEPSTVNEMIMKYIYNPDEKLIFHSYRGWLVEGYQVKRGEKAFLLWSRPVKEVKEEQNRATDEDDDQKFFISYVFSNLQVELIKPQTKPLN